MQPASRMEEADPGSATELHQLALLGRLAPGIAHEVNTLLGVVVTAASHFSVLRRTLVDKLTADALTRGDLDRYLAAAEKAERIMLTNLERAAGLARSFKHVSVAQHHEDTQRLLLLPFLEEVVQSGHSLLRPLSHTLELDCPADLEVETVPGAFASILLNLLSNTARHAVPPNAQPAGPITITIRARPAGERSWTLTYGDTGCGIPEDLIGRVFDPFVTTRRGAGGSGLGLAIVRRMATEALRGEVTLDSAVGKGVLFRFAFPRTLSPTPGDGGRHA